MPCMNTRDMEEEAISGHSECFNQLTKAGGGEKGIFAIAELARLRLKKDPISY